jgi:hypothetical protein
LPRERDYAFRDHRYGGIVAVDESEVFKGFLKDCREDSDVLRRKMTFAQ